MRVLIAEDDVVVRRLLEASLVKWGYEVVVVCDGSEAWEVLAGEDLPELVLLDWMMPGMDGLEVCRRVKSRDGGRYIYVIMLTAKRGKGDVAVGLDAGADDYVTKPFSARELRARVNVGMRMLNLQRSLEEHVKKLEELDRLKSDFLSTVSHELRTPLAIMREGISLCLDGVAGEITEAQKDLLTDTLENNERLTRLITDLLDISKIEAGKVKLWKSSVDLRELVEKIAHSFENQAAEKKIRLKMVLPEEPLKIYADGDKITQIFNNLVSNAIRYTEADGEITILVEEGEDEVNCSVSDTGIGIAEENIPKLFSKFEQFGRVEGPGYKGTGLGLAIVKGLVEKHEGRVGVESKLGKGTTFWFTLKKRPFPKILVVDDDESVVVDAKDYLSEDNYSVVEASDGDVVVEKAQSEKVSLILLDMRLPKMSGYEVIGRLKQDKRTQDIPILMMSSFLVDRECLDQEGVHTAIPFIEKPFEGDVLRRTVKDLLMA